MSKISFVFDIILSVKLNITIIIRIHYTMLCFKLFLAISNILISVLSLIPSQNQDTKMALQLSTMPFLYLGFI